MITVNDVRDGVIAAIKTQYPEIKVYGEEIKQGLVEPRFYVKVLTAGQDREMGRRYKRTHSFDVHYFSQSNEDKQEVAESFYAGLEYIQANGMTFRGQGMGHETIDRVLHFFVDYNFHVMRQKNPETKMQTLKQEANFKND
jgi:hypothetical protein